MMPPLVRRAALRSARLVRGIGAIPLVVGAGCQMMPSREVPDGDTHGVASEAWVKFDDDLRAAIRARDGDPSAAFAVLVLLAPAPSAEPPPDVRSAREERRRAAVVRTRAFQDETAPLVDAVRRAGARDVVPHWINRTVAMVAPRAALEAAARRAEVRSIMRSTTHHAIPD